MDGRRKRFASLDGKVGAIRVQDMAHPVNLQMLHGYYEARDSGMSDEDFLRDLAERASRGELSTELRTLLSGGTSIFDPVLCELAYRWFCPAAGRVLDPFAGGSVRGVVAAALGRHYLGVDLSPEQVAENRKQWEEIKPRLPSAGDGLPSPAWVVGDARGALSDLEPETFDFLFSCPPYYNLERYTQNPADLSNAPSYEDFDDALGGIVHRAVRALKPDRFACFVLGDVRGEDGTYHELPWNAARAFRASGARLFNEAVLVTMVATLPLRLGRQFGKGRKLGKCHQNVLVFLKGDQDRALAALPPPEIGEAEESFLNMADAEAAEEPEP